MCTDYSQPYFANTQCDPSDLFRISGWRTLAVVQRLGQKNVAYTPCCFVIEIWRAEGGVPDIAPSRPAIQSYIR